MSGPSTFCVGKTIHAGRSFGCLLLFGVIMQVAKVTEIIASSPNSFDDAVARGVERASKTLNNIAGVWVKEQKATVENGKITEYRVNLKLTFLLED